MPTLNLRRAVALGAAVLVASVGSAFAATTIENPVDVMAGPGANFHIVAHLNAGSAVSIAQKSSSWCKITTPGATGWVPCTDVAGLTTATPVAPAPAGFQGYNYQTDPYLGPTVQGGLHSVTSDHGFS